MAAATLSFSLSLDPQQYHNKTGTAPASPIISTKHSHFPLHKSNHCQFSNFLSFSHSSSSPAPTTASSFLEDSFSTGRFLTNEELEKLKTLEHFVHFQELQSGFLWVRVMRPEEMDRTVSLLAESFSESMLLPVGYNKLLRFFVKQYLIERRAVMPHAATLIGFYRGKGESESGEDVDFAGTVEVCFDKRGANASPATPTPPKNSPYICNMTVRKERRRYLWFCFHQFFFFNFCAIFKKKIKK